MTHLPDFYLTFLNQLWATRNKILIIKRPAYKFQTKLHTLSQIISLEGVSLSRTFEKSIFLFLFQSMELLSENIVAKFYSPYRNSFDGRVPSSILRGARERLIFHRLKTLKRVFSKPHFSKLRARLENNH